jgi:hypothetical protein
MPAVNPQYIITPAGSFCLEALPDGSIAVRTTKKEQQEWLDKLLWKFLQEVFPGWSARCKTGELILCPPTPPQETTD